MGYYPNEGEFNFAITSQDLYYSYNLYKLTNNSNVKNIIVSFSDFSSWHSLARSPLPYLDYILYYEWLCGIPPEIGQIDIKKIKRLQNIILSEPIDTSYNGEYLYYPNQQYQNNKKDSLMWALKYNNHFYAKRHESLKYLFMLLEQTQTNNQKFIICITPIMSNLFKKISIAQQELFRELYELVELYSNAKILNYRNDKDFTEEDFIDWEHLNLQGAKKLTNKIREVLL